MTNIYRLTNVKTGEVVEGNQDYIDFNYLISRQDIYYARRKNQLVHGVWQVELIGKEFLKNGVKDDYRDPWETKTNKAVDDLAMEANEKGISYGQLVAQRFLEERGNLQNEYKGYKLRRLWDQ